MEKAREINASYCGKQDAGGQRGGFSVAVAGEMQCWREGREVDSRLEHAVPRDNRGALELVASQ